MHVLRAENALKFFYDVNINRNDVDGNLNVHVLRAENALKLFLNHSI